jgi:hypothetical protein
MKMAKHLLCGLCLIVMASCGNGHGSNSDSTNVSHTDSAASPADTAVPAAEQPAGAPNAGEDSARYGTGSQDSTRNKRP